MFRIINQFLSWCISNFRISRYLYVFYSRILPTPIITVRSVNIRCAMPLNRIGAYDEWHRWNSREPETLDWIDKIPSDAVLFDIGASFGNETLYAALKANGPQRIIAFDPNFAASADLSYNLLLNGITHVDQYCAGVGKNSEFLELVQGTNYYAVPGRPKYDQYRCHSWIVDIDTFVRNTGIYPDYVKIDVDGPEYEVLRGMESLVRDRRLASILIEVSEITKAKVVEFMTTSGYSLSFESELSGSSSDATVNMVFSLDGDRPSSHLSRALELTESIARG